MTHIPYLFNQSIEQMRRIGARGGRTHARRNRPALVGAPKSSNRADAAGSRQSQEPCIMGVFEGF